MEHTEIISRYFKEFALEVVNLCGKKEAVPAYFTLVYTRLELGEIFNCREHSGSKKNELAGDYFLVKAIDFIDFTIKWLSKDGQPGPDFPDVCDKPENGLLHWSGKICDFVELVYSLQEAKAINKGQMKMTELIPILCHMFNLQKSDCFAHYSVIRNRPGNRTKFLSKLIRLQEKKIDEAEEKIHKRYRSKNR